LGCNKKTPSFVFGTIEKNNFKKSEIILADLVGEIRERV